MVTCQEVKRHGGKQTGLGVSLRSPMLHRIVAVLLLFFLAAIGVNWPSLPFNASIADLIFVPLAVIVLALPLPRLSWQRVDLAVVIYLLGALPAIAVSTDIRASGVEFVRELYLVAIYIVIAVLAKRRSVEIIGIGLSNGGVALSIGGLFFVIRQLMGAAPFPAMGEVMTLPYLGNVLRLRAFTASEAMFACLLTTAVPFAISWCRRYRSGYWVPAAMTIAAMLTFSHALAGFVTAFVIVMWPSLGRWPRRLAVATAMVVVIGLNVAATVSIKSIEYGGSRYVDSSQYHYAIEERRAQIGGATIVYNVMSYARIKQVAWRTFVEHPIAGVGLDQFHVATERTFTEGRLTSDYREIDPHSTLPGRFAECGLIGGITLILLWVVWGRMAIDGVRLHARRAVPNNIAAPDNIALAAAAAFAGLLVASVNADIMNFRFLWVVAGLLRGLYEVNGIAIASGRDDTVTAGTD